ncbi:CapA family protein [Vibrio campbellii]|uniref:CapA family protein n=1 Tax=Vibrio campbellii TaxID=680 RepID=UPI0009A4CC27|nr:CapA family protein [Vibrio campbellii]OPH51549.1 hypothetical protein B4U81_13935 [Vibrio campbellii]
MRVAFLGDLTFFGRYDIDNLSKGYFQNISDFLNTFDLVVANLEAPFVDKFSGKSNKSAVIYSKPESIELLKRLNVGAVCLANNHIFDFGLNGIKKTISVLDKNNIQWFGVNNKSLYYETEKFSLHGFCSYNTNPIGINFSSKYFLNPTHYSDVMKCVENDVSNNFLSIICNHSGIENILSPSLDDIEFARHISTISDYVYIGHHPHVIQGSEVFNNSHITYSLGNFCFDDIYDERTGQLLVKQSEENKHGLIKTFEIENGKVISSSELICFQGVDEFEIKEKNYAHKLLADEIIKDVNIDYSENRTCLIKGTNKKRNSSRNLSWFLSRLSISTLIRVFQRRLNTYKYNKYFSSKIPRKNYAKHSI